MNTIPTTVQRYCLVSPDRGRIMAPTKEDILSHEIVITTLVTSLILTKLEVQGCFTHIFIDEAAQVLECEAIMPLCLASEATRIVLAGDYHQMCQKVYR
jgi:superfamily I DNA and/or RNA helicase